MPRVASSVLTLSLLLLAITGTNGGSGLPHPAPGDGAALRHALSAQSPSARASSSSALRSLQTYFEGLENAIQQDRRKSAGNAETATCNGLNPWAWNAGVYMKRRGIQGASSKCVTLRFEHNDVPDTPGAHSAFAKVGPAFRTNAATNWTAPVHLVAAFGFNTTGHRCQLRRQAAFRIGKQWFIHVQFTNVALHGEGALGAHSFIAEHVRADGGPSFSSANMSLLASDAKNAPYKPAFTELVHTNGPPPAGGLFGVPELESNPAIAEALVKSENDAEQANDAVQKSNMAILVLPLMMNLVPVALFADVNTLGMILYTALTDVLTAVPLAIKGWELLDISANSHTVAASYYAGEMGPGENAVAELFIAKCHTSDRRVGTGISFIVVAIVFMIFGVSFELFAKRFMRKRRPYTQHQPLGPAAMLMQQGVAATARMGPRGGNPHLHPPNCVCACHARNHPHANAQLHLRAVANGNAQAGSYIPVAGSEYSGDYNSRPQVSSLNYIPVASTEYSGDYNSRPYLPPVDRIPATGAEYSSDYDSRPHLPPVNRQFE